MALTINEKLERLLEKFLPKFLKSIMIDYGIGSMFTIKTSTKKTSMSPLNLSKKDQEANIQIISELVKGVNEDLAKKINYITNKSITERQSNVQLAKELKTIFDKESPNYFDYKNRFKTIARTESTRVLNVGANNTAKRLGAKKKYLFNMMDGRTGGDSKVAESKYGLEDQAIDLDKPFTYSYGKKNYSFLLPPDRPNDRSLVVYLFE